MRQRERTTSLPEAVPVISNCGQDVCLHVQEHVYADTDIYTHTYTLLVILSVVKFKLLDKILENLYLLLSFFHLPNTHIHGDINK